MAYDSLMVFTGNANPKLAADVVKRLNISLGRADVGRFSDGEVSCEILEHVRGHDVFVLQSTCNPTNDNLMELMVMVDALKRASAGRITAAIPYFGYARQDRRSRSARVAITAKVVANMLQSVGVQRVLTVDLHADQIQGFFDIPVDNIYAAPILLGDIWKQRHEDLLVVSPDVGGVVRARALAKRLESDLAIIDKRRPKANVSEVMNIIGEVEGRTCVIMDDMVDTAGTLCKAAQALKEHGAKHGMGTVGQHALGAVHLVQGCPGAQGARRQARAGLLYPSRAVGQCGAAHRRLGARRIGGDRYHSAGGRGALLQAHSPDLDRRTDGRDHVAHQQRGFCVIALHGLVSLPAWSRAGVFNRSNLLE